MASVAGNVDALGSLPLRPSPKTEYGWQAMPAATVPQCGNTWKSFCNVATSQMSPWIAGAPLWRSNRLHIFCLKSQPAVGVNPAAKAPWPIAPKPLHNSNTFRTPPQLQASCAKTKVESVSPNTAGVCFTVTTTRMKEYDNFPSGRVPS